MKKAFVSFVILCSLLVTVMAIYAETIPVKGYVTPDIGLNVRTGPSESSTKIGALSKGENLTIVAVSGSWYKISSPMSGYVHGSYVTVTEYGEGPDEEAEEEANLTPEEADKLGCDIEKSLEKAKVTKAPPQKNP
jgi:uncharacterized protein YgiM (DUF1202 family)